jgi:hypothetical protein
MSAGRIGRRGLLATSLGWCVACAPLAQPPARIRAAVAPNGVGRRLETGRSQTQGNWACAEEAQGTQRLAASTTPQDSLRPALNSCVQPCPRPTAPTQPLPTFSAPLHHRVPRGNPRVDVTFLADDPANGLGLPGPMTPAARRALELSPPAVVREAGEAALLAMERFARAGLRPPLPTRSGLVTIELRTLFLVRGWASQDDENFARVVLDSSLRGDALRETVAHEIFHLIQYAYNSTATSSDADISGESPVFTPMLREGGARVAEMVMNPDASRYEHDAQDWFLPDGTSLARYRAGRRRRFNGTSYGAGIFWKYVAEQHAPPLPRGADPRWSRELATQRLLLEANSRKPGETEAKLVTIEGLRAARRSMVGPGDFDRFLYVKGERDLLASSDTTWGNFQLAVLLNGTAGADSRFRFEDAARWRGITAGRRAVPADQQVDYDELPSERLGLAEGMGERPRNERTHTGAWGPDMLLEQRIEERTTDLQYRLGHALGLNPPLPAENSSNAPIRARMLDPFSMMTFRVRLQPSTQTRLLRVEWEPLAGLEDGMVQVVLLDQAGELLDLYRHDGHPRRAMNHRFACRLVSEVLIVVASRVAPGNFRLRLAQAADSAILAVANWNCRAARHLTHDPATQRHDWRSKDTDFSTSRERVEFPDGQLRWWQGFVRVMVRNRGTERAENVRMEGYRRHRNGGDWEEIPCVSVPATLETDDECRRLDAEVPIEPKARMLPAPCQHIDQIFNLATLRNATMPGRFLWPGGAPADYLMRFVIRADNDPNGATTILTSFGAGDPDPRPSTPATTRS